MLCSQKNLAEPLAHERCHASYWGGGEGRLASRDSCLPQAWARGLGVAKTIHSCQWRPWQEPGTQKQQSPANTFFSSFSWLSGSIQKARQGPLPAQELLVGTHLCNGPIFQHHNPIGLGQDVERVSHENPRLDRERVEVTLMCLTAFWSWEVGTGSAWGSQVGRLPLHMLLPSFLKVAHLRDIEGPLRPVP